MSILDGNGFEWAKNEFEKSIRMMVRDQAPIHTFDIDARRDGNLEHWTCLIAFAPKQQVREIMKKLGASLQAAEPLEDNLCHIRSAWPEMNAMISLCGLDFQHTCFGGIASADCKDCLVLALRAGHLNEMESEARKFAINRLQSLGIIK